MVFSHQYMKKNEGGYIEYVYINIIWLNLVGGFTEVCWVETINQSPLTLGTSFPPCARTASGLLQAVQQILSEMPRAVGKPSIIGTP